jgi:hypothetical protein
VITASPVAALSIKAHLNARVSSELSEPIYGGYVNGRGEIVLFGKDLAYLVNLKKQTVQQRLRLNSSAQARYDATEAGKPFEYCNKTFHRLSIEQITEICMSGDFKISPRRVL